MLGGRLTRGINPLKLDNRGFSLALPFSDERISTRNAFDESFRSHRPCDAEWPQIISEVEKPAPIFETGNVLADKNRSILNLGLSKSHTTPSQRLLNTSEQLPSWAYIGSAVQSINRFTNFLFDQRLSALADMLANDNWHPLEAA
jgi:hypothetical protein